MAEHNIVLAKTQNDGSSCDRAVFLLLLVYLYEELAQPHLRLRRPFAARPIHIDLPDTGNSCIVENRARD
jgi:hypothetical protein